MPGDLVTEIMNERLFTGGIAPPGTADPGDSGYDDFREQAQGAAPIPTATVPSVSPTDAARAADLVGKIGALLQRTNITASLPAHAEPTPWSNPIDLSTTVNVAAAAGAYQTVLSYTAPPGRYARISGYGFDVDGAYTYNGSLLWRLLLQGTLAGGMDPWAEHRGSIIQPRSAFIIVPEGQTLLFQVQRAVAAGGPSAVQMCLTGWTWRLRNNYQGTAASLAGV